MRIKGKGFGSFLPATFGRMQVGVPPSTLALVMVLCAAAISCSGEEGECASSASADEGDTFTLRARWIDGSDEDRYPQPLTVRLLDACTHEPIPGLEESYQTDRYSLAIPDVPSGADTVLWTVGNDLLDTHDVISMSPREGEGEFFVYLSSEVQADFYSKSGAFEPRSDRAAVHGNVFYQPGGRGTRPESVVECAQVFLDGGPEPLDAATDQRYITGVFPRPGPDATGLNGDFYFGNMTPGRHTLTISLDGGITRVDGAELTFDVFAVREDARGPFENITYEVRVYSPLPTPEGCESE